MRQEELLAAGAAIIVLILLSCGAFAVLFFKGKNESQAGAPLQAAVRSKKDLINRLEETMLA